LDIALSQKILATALRQAYYRKSKPNNISPEAESMESDSFDRPSIDVFGLDGRLIFTVLIILLLATLGVKAQTPAPSPEPLATPQVIRNRGLADPTASRPVNNTSDNREADAAFKDLQALEIPVRGESPDRSLLIEFTRNLYRKPNKNEMKILAPTADYLNKYALFLKQPRSGIIKLKSDSSCVGSSGLVVAKENCLQYSMPGAGTSFSFRVENHRIPNLSDLTLSKNVLKSDGVLQHGILVKLGDVPIEDITLQTAGLTYLADFKPLTDSESLAKFDLQLQQGVKADGFVYGLALYVRDQTTYALRSIAYKGKVMRSFKGIDYNELDYDKRRDVLVVFRVIEMEANGSITLVWKILSSKESPELKIKEVANNK
jgi:hypothetical protein